ncbi:hypothetical protein DM01DRAFT_1316736 [Hesseltinella vesiculosa]|uniref:Uncharacterized protein n=1 Tax=Hesseltinella vesiculosa TaxID=101127 RepID=A0A1X2GS04_9FUNG|nr:hypothetical protein DM01DRAFT_1316736 [Hesseltinella vesiculosa]
MPPSPDDIPCQPPSRRFSAASIPQAVYLGLDVETNEESNESLYTISVHDGSYTTDYYSGTLKKHSSGATPEECSRQQLEQLLRVVSLYATSQQYKVQIVACSPQTCSIHPAASVLTAFWRDLDAIPFQVQTDAPTSDERASACVRKAVIWLSPQYPGNLPRISVGFRHEVKMDFDHLIRLVDLADYEKLVSKDSWRVWNEMAIEFKRKNLRVSYFNSTPQGGGVALMRHALVRFLRLNGITVHWYVARPKPEVFDITKRKFHNVLQGVAPPDVCLNEDDKEMFKEWTRENVERFWLGKDGPIASSDVIIIDDPQGKSTLSWKTTNGLFFFSFLVCGVIPYIKKHSPKTRIIYRSHIEIRADLIRQDPHGPQAITWNFIWSFVQHADLFVAHPMNSFVPDDVPRENVCLLPACTDPLDGLNKELSHGTMTYYRSVFNRICMDQGANEVDWSRPYIVQVARFDPSKGIPDVLEAYRLLRSRMDAESFPDSAIPQLVLCGHGSIDDPDGSIIYEQTHATIHSTPFASIQDDIIAARLQPSDQLLNMILRGAHVALQLSHREGFEVKVTEAFQKGVPLIAYEAGGIPLQIIRNVTGFLVPIGDIQGVADHLYQLLTDPALHKSMSNAGLATLTEEYFTVWNTMAWIHLCNEMTDCPGESKGMLDVQHTNKLINGLGHNRYVRTFWFDKYHFQPPATFRDHSLEMV